MDSIPQIATEMQRILTVEAEQIAREKGFVQRTSKMNGSIFAQTLVFGWMNNPQATLGQLTQTAATLGVAITVQGLDDRFTQKASEYLKEVLAAGARRVVEAQPVAIPILNRFSKVFVQDSTLITLPNELVSVWQGCGGTSGKGQSAVKIEVRWELRTGQLSGPYLENGRVNEHRSLINQEPLPEGSLMIADLGYWSLKRMDAQAASGRYWLSYLRTNTVIYDEQMQRLDLLACLKALGLPKVELAVHLGENEKLPARLLAVRVPQEVADRRRARIHDVARRTQRPANPEALALADWTIVVTNVPVQRLGLCEALILIRIRWQIELLFKLWKSHGQIDKWRSGSLWRILCEIYMKLLGLLFQHWLLILCCWQFPDRSLFKAAQTVQGLVSAIMIAFADLEGLSHSLDAIRQILLTGCRVNKSRVYRRSFQLLLDCPSETLA